MTESSTPARPPFLSPVAALLLPLAGLVWAFWTTFIDLAHAWKDNPQYSHGWLVPVFAAVLLYARRNRLDLSTFRPSVWGLPVLAIGIAVRLLGAYFYWVWLDPISLLPTLLGLGLLVAGWGFVRWAWPAVLFLAFMIPLPFSLAVALSGPLQHLATVVSTFVMQVVGLPALAEGNLILLNEHQINIVEACSGLSMLVVFVALSAAMAIVVARPIMDRLLLFVSAVPIAVVANILRITVTGVLYDTVSGETAHAFFHDVAGWLMMPLALGMLWVELKILDRLFVAVPVSARVPAPRRTPVEPRGPRPRQAPPPARSRSRVVPRTGKSAPTAVEKP